MLLLFYSLFLDVLLQLFPTETFSSTRQKLNNAAKSPRLG